MRHRVNAFFCISISISMGFCVSSVQEDTWEYKEEQFLKELKLPPTKNCAALEQELKDSPFNEETL